MEGYNSQHVLKIQKLGKGLSPNETKLITSAIKCSLTFEICVSDTYPVWQDLSMFCGRQRALKPPISSSLTVEPQAQHTSAQTFAKKHSVSLVGGGGRQRESSDGFIHLTMHVL